jgi:hypothetical protein
MSDTAPSSSAGRLPSLPLAIVFRSALLLRMELARRTRHRIALALCVLVVGHEVYDQLLGKADWASASWALSVAAWCAALSASTVVGASEHTTMGDLLRLRGRASSALVLSGPLSRVLLAFGLQGACCIAVGLSRMAQVGPAWALVTTAGLLLTSLAFSVVLSALGWLSSELLPESPSVVYWGALLVPVLLGGAIVELDGVLECWHRLDELLLRLGAG